METWACVLILSLVFFGNVGSPSTVHFDKPIFYTVVSRTVSPPPLKLCRQTDSQSTLSEKKHSKLFPSLLCTKKDIHPNLNSNQLKLIYLINQLYVTGQIHEQCCYRES